jgi:ATP-binding cassette subfamily B protein
VSQTLDSKFTHRNLFWSNRSSVFKGSLCLIVVDLLVFTLPLLVKIVIDRLQGRSLPHWLPEFFSKTPTMAFILSLSFFYIALNALIALIRYWWRVHLIWSTFPLFHKIRRELFQHIQNLDREFFKSHKVGDLISALSTDTENLRMTLSIGGLMLIDAAINFILFPFLLWQLNPTLTLFVVPPLLGISLLALFLSDRLSKEYERVQEITADLSGRAYEVISGVRVIKAFRKEGPVHDDFVQKSRDLRDASISVARFQSLFSPVLEYSISLALVVVLLYGGNKVLQGELPLSNLIAFQIYLAHMDWPMNAIGWFIQLYRISQASQKRIQKFARIETSLRGEERPVVSSPSAPLFKLENVHFAYGGARKFAFQNLGFEIVEGGWIGLTGPVGCGKTTLLELLSRQRDPLSGEIDFRGQNLKGLSRSRVSQQILYVPQEAFMFSRSVRRNLALGLEAHLSDEKLWELLSDLSFDAEALRERGGLNIRLGERGVNLSGGQRQRISLGRALLRQREVFLLDDLFSHIDAETESKLLSSLKERIPVASTVILVSQRMATLKKCREVLVLNDGGLEFKGPVDLALERSEFFKRLQLLQDMEQAV